MRNLKNKQMNKRNKRNRIQRTDGWLQEGREWEEGKWVKGADGVGTDGNQTFGGEHALLCTEADIQHCTRNIQCHKPIKIIK